MMYLSPFSRTRSSISDSFAFASATPSILVILVISFVTIMTIYVAHVNPGSKMQVLPWFAREHLHAQRIFTLIDILFIPRIARF